MLSLTISTENAAFEGEQLGLEIARILRQAADSVTHLSGTAPRAHLTLRDVNGNRVGALEYTKQWPTCPVDGEPMEDGICSACLDRDQLQD